MTRPQFDQIKADIMRPESRGDYDALWNYQNRPGGDFEQIKITDMTVDEALHFSSSKGSNYGNYVQSELNKIKPGSGVFATPMGAFQVVGRTLKDAKRGLGLSGDEKMTPAMQDLIGQYIYNTQGTKAWAGYKGPAYGPKKDRTMTQPVPEQPTEQPGIMGLISKGLQNKDLMNRLALGFNSMRLDPDPNLAAGIRESMSDRRELAANSSSKNATVAHLRKIGETEPYALELADAVETGGLGAKAALTSYYQSKMAGQTAQRTDVYKVPEGSVTVSSKKNGETEYRLNGRLVTDPGEIQRLMGQANVFEVDQAGSIQGAKTTAEKTAIRNEATRTALYKAKGAANSSRTVIANMMQNQAGMESALGVINGSMDINNVMVSEEARNFITFHEQLQGQIFMTAFQALKGGGSITEVETRAATAAMNRMSRQISKEDYIAALQEFRAAVMTGIQLLEADLADRPIELNEEPIQYQFPDLG